MKKICLSFILFLNFFTLFAKPAIPYDRQLEERVEKILNSMNLQQKVGQMCELTVDVLINDKNSGRDLSREKLLSAFDKYKVGSILNVPRSSSLTPEEWSSMIRELNEMSAKVSNGLAEIYGVDQIHGASYTLGATLFPQEIGQAASFNKNIPYRISEISAYETRACLIPWVYSPVLDLGRQPLWSRMWESYGEDVYLNGVMASQAVRGYQGDNPNELPFNKVASCLKHYMGYGAPVTGKDRTPTSITEREMREKYFEPFRIAINSGALSLMVNSGVNNGIPFHANYKFLTEWLKEDLEWDGMIVTDWGDINNLWKRDFIAKDKKDAIRIAINAGIDMAMEPNDTDFCDLLIELVKEGKVSMDRINDAVSRIIRLKLRLGLDNKKTWDMSWKQLKDEYPDFGSKKFAEEAKEMAAECMVLLKNEKNILPLSRDKKIFLCGPNSDNLRGMNGGWTYTWQGAKTNEIGAKIGNYPTFKTALMDKFGPQNIIFEEGVRWSSDDFDKDEIISDLSSLKDKAMSSDVIIVCLGENSYCETPGNITDLNISPNQNLLVSKLYETGKPIIIILAEGRPRVLRDIEKVSSAIVQTFLPGNYGGLALAELLSGEKNFSGRLPYTYPKHTGSLQVYDYKPCENMGMIEGGYNYEAVMDVQWPFGYGLSYTQFNYSNLKCNLQNFSAKDILEVSVDVTNMGNIPGKESVLFYSSDLVASISPDIRRLRAFEKIDLNPGEKKTVKVKIPASELAFVDNDMKWKIEEGEFRISVGNLHIMLRCLETYTWDNPNREF